MNCRIPSCPRAATVRLDLGGYCRNHYIRERTRGRIPKLERPSALERFHRLVVVDQDTGCHIWQGTRTRRGPDGYGLFKVTTKTTRIAHRWLWEQTYGPLLRETQLDHYVCDNPPCVNLEHLRPATPRQNLLRSRSFVAVNAAKTHCLRGHPFDAANTYVTPSGKRACRTCKSASDRRRRAHLKQPQ